MSNIEPQVGVKPVVSQKSILKSILLTLPMALLIFMMLMGSGGHLDVLTIISALTAFIFLTVLFFLMIHTQKTYKYRTILFVTSALCFIITFMTNIIEERGSIILNAGNMISGETPFCHLVLPMVIIPAALTKTIIFPGSMLKGFANVAGMIVIWIGASLALGRGWCSWACFYGGLDEGFSKLCKKPKIKKINTQWTYMPYAVLIAIVLISAATLSPTYCEWLCPFKAVTEFKEIISFKVVVQTIIFVTLFLGLVVILPILTGKRTQCSFLCPYAAFQSFTNKINIFDIRIDTEKCVNCGKCIRECPTFSINKESVKNGKALMNCTKCGKCVDICPKGAVSYHVKGTKIGVRAIVARNLFLYPAYLFGATFAGGFISGAIFRILKLITTGSMF